MLEGNWGQEDSDTNVSDMVVVEEEVDSADGMEQGQGGVGGVAGGLEDSEIAGGVDEIPDRL